MVIRHRPNGPASPDLAEIHRTAPGRQRSLSLEDADRIYGAAQEDLDAVVEYVTAHGMTVLESHAGKRCVTIQGTAGEISAAFGVELNLYESPLPDTSRHGGRESEAPPPPQMHRHRGFDGAVHLPPELHGLVVGVVGFDDRPLGVPGGSGDPADAASLAVPAAAQFYNFLNTGAADQVIGIIAQQVTPGNGASYLAADINNNYFPNLANVAYRTAPASINNVNLTVGTTTYSNNPATVQTITPATFNLFPFDFIIELTRDISTSATVAQGPRSMSISPSQRSRGG